MSAVEKYQELVNMGLIIPTPELPLRLKFPTLLVYVPNITTNGIVDPEAVKRVAQNAELERSLK
jgi:hypothetical protein